MIKSIRRWISYRTYKKYHLVRTGLKPDYYDKDTIMLHANFSLLVDFVEVELATLMNYEQQGKRKVGRDAKLGLEWLTQRINEAQDAPASESETLRDIKELYVWWTIERPNYHSPDKEVGLDKFYDRMLEKYKILGCRVNVSDDGTYKWKRAWTDAEDEEYNRLIQETERLESTRYELDTTMLKKLIGCRAFLWT